MKYTFLFSVLFATLFCSAQTSSGNTQVTFGRYSNCTSGRGVCSFSVSGTQNGISGFSKATKVNENTIVVQLNKANLSVEDQIKIAGKPFNELKENEPVSFTQTEDLSIDSATLQNLGINSKYHNIPTGNYQMTVTKDKIEILFLLKS